ncbi:MAG: biopolymer transporter ExbD [Planctomycetota bacterium]
MKTPRRAEPRSIGMNVTPMIDVVFLLIIFFLVSSHLARQETQLELNLPVAAGDEPTDAARPRVTLNVLADGSVLLGGEALPMDQIERRLAYEQQQSETGIEVRIRGDRAAEYRTVEPLLAACAKAGVWNVAFNVFEEK